MNIQVKLFGVLAEIVGSQKIEVNYSGDIESVKKQLIQTYPKLGQHKFLVSVDQKLETHNRAIGPEHEIAFLPPFAGG